MGKFAPFLRFISINTIVACVTVGIALGVTNVLVNHVHWLGAYLIACPARSWNGPPLPVQQGSSSRITDAGGLLSGAP